MSATETAITATQLAEHNTRESLWVGVHGHVYDLTTFCAEHPGGIEVLVDCAGTDGSEAYDYAGHSELNMAKLQEYRVGPLAGAVPQPAASQLLHSLKPTSAAQSGSIPQLRQYLAVSPASVKRGAVLLGVSSVIILVASRLKQMGAPHVELLGGSIWLGMAIASSVSFAAFGYMYKIFLSTLKYDNDIFAFPPTVPRKRKARK